MSSPIIAQRSLGGDASHVKVGAVGYGAMMLTWTAPENVASDEDAFDAIKTAIDAGATFINSGAFYGNSSDGGLDNLRLLNRFFQKYPEYVDTVVLSVKGGMKGGKLMQGPDSSEDNLREDLERIREALGPHKKVDLYEPARVDPKLTIEETMNNLVTLKNEGYFNSVGVQHISLSEIAASALRKAHATHPVAAVEIELSLFGLEPEALDVLKVCDELDIALVAYSPLGRGFLAGRYRSPDDLKDGDMRKMQPRFQGESFYLNLKVVDAVNEIAQRKGVTPAQLALAYIMGMSDKASLVSSRWLLCFVIPIPGSSSTTRTVENIKAAGVTISQKERNEIDEILNKASPLL
ncbi:hypothetical protein QFC22_006393 [Naganishia vaughanmartiniae]|uniref:Uncharacterized protein n=1 Tax=Naganishia vaughanmartiniae TaxID=1424756 RepID=A0ACC2WKU2_9TREE|nr:hypothetical protein QFC22_006393 [Naganishia vaughanmartiniae]